MPQKRLLSVGNLQTIDGVARADSSMQCSLSVKIMQTKYENTGKMHFVCRIFADKARLRASGQCRRCGKKGDTCGSGTRYRQESRSRCRRFSDTCGRNAGHLRQCEANPVRWLASPMKIGFSEQLHRKIIFSGGLERILRPFDRLRDLRDRDARSGRA